MNEARLCADGTARWVESYCPTPLQEEQPYWEKYFELTKIQDAHDRRRCRDYDGSEPWACGNRDCTGKLERRLEVIGTSFLESLRVDSPQELLTRASTQSLAPKIEAHLRNNHAK